MNQNKKIPYKIFKFMGLLNHSDKIVYEHRDLKFQKYFLIKVRIIFLFEKKSSNLKEFTNVG